MTHHGDYFSYLRQRSLLGYAYRRLWLYPRLCRFLQGKTLDVGCGVGDLLRHRPETIGVDVNPDTVTWCQSRGLDARLMAVDVLPFDDGALDSVMLDNVLEHLLHPAPLLADIRRVLRDKGMLVVGVPGRKGYLSDPDHKHFYDEADMISTVQVAGFQHLRTLHMPLRMRRLENWMRQYCIYGIFRAR